VLGLMLVSLARIALGTDASARAMMKSLGDIRATLVRTATGAKGQRPWVPIAPELTAEQRHAARVFELDRWFPGVSSSRRAESATPGKPAPS